MVLRNRNDIGDVSLYPPYLTGLGLVCTFLGIHTSIVFLSKLQLLYYGFEHILYLLVNPFCINVH